MKKNNLDKLQKEVEKLQADLFTLTIGLFEMQQALICAQKTVKLMKRLGFDEYSVEKVEYLIKTIQNFRKGLISLKRSEMVNKTK